MEFITDKKDWNRTAIENNGQFLQSWEWGDLQEKIGRSIWRVRAGNIQALLIKYPLPLGRSYLYCPAGPLVLNPNAGFAYNWKSFAKAIKKDLPNFGQIFLKIEPWNPKIDVSEIEKFGLIKSRPLQPDLTRIIETNGTEEEILRRMEHDTRYAIKTAEKRGVAVSIFDNNEEKEMMFEEFWKVFDNTNKRQGLKRHSKDYYKLVTLLDGDCQSKLFISKIGDKIVNAAIVVYFGKTAFYLYAASESGFGRFNAPSLTLWKIIMDAKRLGMNVLNTGGISHIKKSMAGITAFKKSFGGYEVAYPGAWDLPLKKNWYAFYRIARLFKG